MAKTRKRSLRSLKDLRPAPYNPRTISDEAMAGLQTSIETFGDISGLVWNRRTGHLACGHQRLDALRRRHGKKLRFVAGAKPTIKTPDGDFPVRVVDWDEDQEKLANLAANNPHIAGAFSDGLPPLVADLAGKDRLTDLVRDLRIDLLTPSLMVAGQTEADAVPEAEAAVVSKPGDLWLCGSHRVLCGDATVAGDVAEVLASREPFIMVTDPPYGVEYDPEWRVRYDGEKRSGLGRVRNDDQASWREAFAHFPGHVGYVWCAGIQVPTTANDLLACGFGLRWLIVWGKTKQVFGRGHYHSQSEMCWYVANGVSKWNGDRTQTTLWVMRNAEHEPGEKGHGTQKPVECMARPIRNHGGKDDDVYDPFLGSGTTMIAAEQLGRKCYGIEIEPKYVDVCVRRWQQFTGKTATLDGQTKTFDEIAAKRKGTPRKSKTRRSGPTK